MLDSEDAYVDDRRLRGDQSCNVKVLVSVSISSSAELEVLFMEDVIELIVVRRLRLDLIGGTGGSALMSSDAMS